MFVYIQASEAGRKKKAAGLHYSNFGGCFLGQLLSLAGKIEWEHIMALVTKVVPLDGPTVYISLFEMAKAANKLVDLIRKKNNGKFPGFSEEEVSMLAKVTIIPNHLAQEKLKTYIASQKSKNNSFWEEMNNRFLARNRALQLNHAVIPFFDKFAKTCGFDVSVFADDIEWMHTADGADMISKEMKVLSRLGALDFRRYRDDCDKAFSGMSNYGAQAYFRKLAKDFIIAVLRDVASEKEKAYVFRFLETVVPDVMDSMNWAKIKYFTLLSRNISATNLIDLEDLKAFLNVNAKDGLYTKVAVEYPWRLKELTEIARYNITFDDVYHILIEAVKEPLDLSWIETHKVKRKDILNSFRLLQAGVPENLLFAS